MVMSDLGPSIIVFPTPVDVRMAAGLIMYGAVSLQQSVALVESQV